LLHGWEEYGKAILDKLRGMFAFIIWDSKTQTAFGAKDPFGVKPLYFTRRGDTFVYASEIKSILEYPGVERELNLEALEQYLSFQYSALPETFFKGIFRFGPGECFTYGGGTLQVERYFDPLPASGTVDDVRAKMKQEGSTESDPFAYTVERIKEAVKESVQAHMVSDVEIGALLSSGIDSSYIAALYPNDRTYTVGYELDDTHYNEISFAHKTAEDMGKTHISRVISTEDYWNTVPKTMYYMDEPLADPSAVSLFFLTEMVSKDVKVVFSGEGADEFFGGYPIYHEPLGLAGFQKLPRGLRRGLAAVARAIPFRFKGKSFLDRASKTVEERYISNAYLFNVEEREAILKAPLHAPAPETLTQPFYAKVKGAKDTNKMQYIDYNFWVPGDIMLKGDRMAMANSLEVRSPLLDKKVFALANTLPLEFLLNDETTKVALRAAASEVLPERVSKKPKAGFPTPTRVWLREERWYRRVREAFEGETARQFFNVEPLVKLLEDHFHGKADNSRKIWNIYVFLIWYGVYFENSLEK
jgi:asparagine synthase (glutamine-hydrolysing)